MNGAAALPLAKKWPCRAAVIRAAERGRRSWKPFSCNHGERVPVRPDPIRHAAEIYGVTGRDAQIAGQSRFTNPTTTCLEARSVLRIRKLKIKPFDAWDVWICKHNVNGKVVTRTPQQESKHRPDYTHERKLRLQKLCIARRSHQWHAASVHILCHLCLTYCCCCRCLPSAN